ncbi:MAG TPA: peptidoglycan DD-metalloendopeptidase family protein [Flavobacterium lutivivi]|nr:peptidoglycan DD-metalloendopeptidase family protein [Flavobacterium lutivivi]
MSKKLLTILFFCFASQLWCQITQEQLEERKAKIQAEIKEKEDLLKSMKTKEKSVINQLLIQKEKIGLKEKLIRTTESQTKVLSNDIYVNQLKINQLNRDLEKLREDYAEMIRKSYKSRSEQSKLMFLLSSENFFQAYKRLQYMKQYASFRKMQAEEIKSKSEELEVHNRVISEQKTEKEKLIAENEKERKELEKEKQEQEKIANQIKKDKGKIAAEIKKKQQETKRIDAQIQKLIRDAIAAANKKTAAAKAKANPKTTTAAETKKTETSAKIVLTPEGQLVANNFRANKGRLPWPVEKGAVSLPYGDQPHPVYKTLTVHNSGVEISTENGANARAVFNGEVANVIVLSPVNKAVMIQHGDYFTVYQNLSSVSVSKGDKVSTKQSLGKIRTNGETGKTVLKFMILQNTTYNNPASWLSNM